MSPEKLAYMANQIGKFFAHQPHDKAVGSITDHLQKYWDPRMRRTILQQYEVVREQLDPLVRQAIEQLRKADVS